MYSKLCFALVTLLVLGCTGSSRETDSRAKASETALLLLNEAAGCMDRYQQQNGKYPTNIFDLASVNIHPKSFIGDMAGVFGENPIEIKIDHSGKKYTLTGYERFYNQKVVVTGPK